MSIFKEYDVRGKSSEFDENNAKEITNGYVALIKPKYVVVGRDGRETSPQITSAVIDKLISLGINVIDIGISSTPYLYFCVARNNYDGGIMITASHNPPDYNGMKMVSKEAMAVRPKDVQKMMKNKLKKIKGRFVEKDFRKAYEKHVLGFSKTRFGKIVVDCANGVTGLEEVKILRKIAKVDAIFTEVDGTFPNHSPNPLLKGALTVLKKRVKKTRARLGIAFDGDGDRIIFVDEEGNTIEPDLVTTMLADYLMEKGDKAGYEARSSWIVKEIMEKKGKGVMIKSGHPNITEAMRKEEMIMTGEKSGHYYYKNNFYTDSAIITAILMFNLIGKKKISQVIKKYKKYHSIPEWNVYTKQPAKIIQVVKKRYTGKTNWIDGIRVEMKDWWIHVRKSNTEPLVRINMEAKTKKMLISKKKEVEKLTKPFSYNKPFK